LAVAEAGVHRALAILESVAPDGRTPGRAWRPLRYVEQLPSSGSLEGRFTLALSDEPGGAIVVTSTGEVGGVQRRLRARVFLASPALLAALFGASFVRLEGPPAATFILPYDAGIGDRLWIHIAAGRAVWFATSNISINEPSGTFDVGPGPVDGPAARAGSPVPPRLGSVRFLLAQGAELLFGQDQQRVDVDQLRAAGVYIEGDVLRSETLPTLPAIDQEYYRTLAAANNANARLNQAAGKFVGDADLANKLNSLYSPREFQLIQTYLKAGLQPPRLSGVIYISSSSASANGWRSPTARLSRKGRCTSARMPGWR
jgi:hypothetical protein